MTDSLRQTLPPWQLHLLLHLFKLLRHSFKFLKDLPLVLKDNRQRLEPNPKVLVLPFRLLLPQGKVLFPHRTPPIRPSRKSNLKQGPSSLPPQAPPRQAIRSRNPSRGSNSLFPLDLTPSSLPKAAKTARSLPTLGTSVSHPSPR